MVLRLNSAVATTGTQAAVGLGTKIPPQQVPSALGGRALGRGRRQRHSPRSSDFFSVTIHLLETQFFHVFGKKSSQKSKPKPVSSFPCHYNNIAVSNTCLMVNTI